MPEFLVELYASRDSAAAVEQGAEEARQAAVELNQQGTRVRFLRSLFVPEDETCFYLFEADSAESVRAAAQRAGLRFDRVAEAVST